MANCNCKTLEAMVWQGEAHRRLMLHCPRHGMTTPDDAHRRMEARRLASGLSEGIGDEPTTGGERWCVLCEGGSSADGFVCAGCRAEHEDGPIFLADPDGGGEWIVAPEEEDLDE